MKSLTIQLDEQLLQQLERVAVLEKKSVSALIREAAMAYLVTKKDMTPHIAEGVYADDASFDEAMEESFQQFDSVYKTLAK